MLNATGLYSLAEDTLLALQAAGKTVATVESCTGGLLVTTMTDVPGCSKTVMGGIITYSNKSKEELADVPADVLEAHGAVSEEVARAMAVGGRVRMDADVAVAVTGIAGPSGGSEEKPVGLVHLAVANGSKVLHRRAMLPGGRDEIRAATVRIALELIQDSLR
jgi:nicotinamide-nucleotide amidase